MKIFAAGVLVILLAACTSPALCNQDKGFGLLVITQFPDQNELGRYALGPDKGFSLTFIHSVSKTRVIDIYEVRKERIIQTEEIFKAHGAGLPSSPEEPGGISWEKTKENFILHMERSMPKLVVRTDKLYQNRLMVNSRTIDLNQWDDQALLIYFKAFDATQ